MKNTDAFLEDIQTEIDRHQKEVHSIFATSSNLFSNMQISRQVFTNLVQKNYAGFAHQSAMRHLQLLKNYFEFLLQSGSGQQIEPFIDSVIKLMDSDIEKHENHAKAENVSLSEMYANLLKSSNYASCKMLHSFLSMVKETHF